MTSEPVEALATQSGGRRGSGGRRSLSGTASPITAQRDSSSPTSNSGQKIEPLSNTAENEEVKPEEPLLRRSRRRTAESSDNPTKEETSTSPSTNTRGKRKSTSMDPASPTAPSYAASPSGNILKNINNTAPPSASLQKRIESLTNTPKKRSKLSTPVPDMMDENDPCSPLPSAVARKKTSSSTTSTSASPIRPSVKSSGSLFNSPKLTTKASPIITPKQKKFTPPPNFSVPLSQIYQVRALILSKLSGAPLPRLIKLDPITDELYAIFERTILSRESNSAIIAGPRGTGKRACVASVLNRLHSAFPNTAVASLDPDSSNEQADSSIEPQQMERFYVIRLNGMIHVDDKLALDAIINALHLKDALADTCITSYAETLEFVIKTLAAGSLASIPVIVIMEEFDMFLDHYNQSLVYTLLDTVQNRQNPMTVLGISNRMDSSERLEKRVKSRFSNRILHVHTLPLMQNFLTVAQVALQIGSKEMGDESGGISKAYRDLFNTHVSDILADPAVVNSIQAIFDRNRSVPQLFQAIRASILNMRLPPMCDKDSLNAEIQDLSVAFFLDIPSIQCEITRLYADPQLVVIQNLTSLEHCLLAAIRKSMSLDTHLFNFEMIYDMYMSFLKRMANQGKARILHFSKQVAFVGWEMLIRMNVLVSAGDKRCQKEYQIVRCVLDHVQLEGGMRCSPNCPEVLVKWAFTE